jgi:acyl-CoA reductase-like NAD-dependent aldehyde dehydrogenase
VHQYSLAAGVWSAEISRVHRMAAGLKAGTVWINTYGYTDVRLRWRISPSPRLVCMAIDS